MDDFPNLGGVWDQRTVTPTGEPVHPAIEGVLTRKVVTHADHRGRLFEVMNQKDEFWAEPVVHSYVFTIRELTLKGWGVHREKSDRYCLLDGETITLLYDGRPWSPTHELLQVVPLSVDGIRQVLIPPGVWHLSINTASKETSLLNFPTHPYRYDNPDRMTLPWDTAEIPADVASYFPRQLRAPASE